ncbi:MAG TPA: peptidoglycan DD-metalloendopeptidase family protein [Egibacteraceae bacterium]|nr:peptidoglycan DD-metalloendopeptidase family protein [Egibacteraceae bacterium]
MRDDARLRRAARAGVTLLCVAAMLLPAAAGAATDPEAELDDVNQQLEDARRGLETVEGQLAVGLADLQQVDASLTVLDSELAVLSGELAAAEAGLEAAEASLAATTQKVVATQRRLDDARGRLADTRGLLSNRLRSTYKRGGVGKLAFMVDFDDLNELTASMRYIQAALDSDREQIDRISGLEREVLAEAAALAQIQDREIAERTRAQAERDRMDGIVAQRAEVRAQVAAEVQFRESLVAQIESDRASHQALVDSLEAESAQLEAELRRLAEEAARRAAEANQPPTAPVVGTGQLQWPAAGSVTSGFGWRVHPIFETRRFHAGIDIGGGSGAPIYAAEDGVVVSAGTRGGYGNAVVIDHGGGLATLYAHQSRIAVSGGQSVARGQIIGYIGSTGYSTGPHLHFEVRVNGEPQNPLEYL